MSARVLGYRESQIIELVAIDLAERGRVRSYEAIAAVLGMKHKSGVCNVIGRLEHRGLIHRVGDIGRRTITATTPE